MNTEQSKQAYPYVIGAAGLGVFGLLTSLVSSVFLIEIFASVEPGVRSHLPARYSVTSLGHGLGLTIVVIFYLYTNDHDVSYLRIRWPTLRDILISIGGIVILFVILYTLIETFSSVGITPTEHSIADVARDYPQLLIPLIPISILVTGPAEELLYRGLIQTKLRERFVSAQAIGIAAIIFSVVHIPAYAAGGTGWAQLTSTLIILLILGGVLGSLYEYTDNLIVPAIAHGGYNAILYTTSYITIV